MRRSVVARVALLVIGVVVWGYGYRYEQPDIRLGAIGILALALLLRFLPARFFGDDELPPRE